MIDHQKIVEKIKEQKTPLLISISGFGGAGKSTLANELGRLLDAPVICTDSFINGGIYTADYHTWEVIDIERLKEQVLVPLKSGEKSLRYRDTVHGPEYEGSTIGVRFDKYIILEGVGLFRREIKKLLGFSIWIDCPIDVAISRGESRDNSHYLDHKSFWEGLWKQNDIEFFEKYKPNKLADIVVSSV